MYSDRISELQMRGKCFPAPPDADIFGGIPSINKVRNITDEERSYVDTSETETMRLWRSYEVDSRRYQECLEHFPEMSAHLERLDTASLVFASLRTLQLDQESEG